MEKNKKYRWLLVVAAVIVVIVLFLVLLGFGTGNSENKEKIGFILSGSMSEDGWNGRHYQGMKLACEEAGVSLLVAENVPEFSGQCEEAVHELVEKGCKMLVLSSYGYAKEIHQIAEEYPDIVFYVNSSEYHEENMTSYFVKMYQPRYLSGIIAGMMTKSNKIGYVAAMSNNEVNRGISAFALGVRRVNPEAEVIVSYTGAWDNEAVEKAAAQTLIGECGVDVITCHQNQPFVAEVAEQAGIYSIGYHETNQTFSENYLTTVQCDWSMVYRELVQDFLKGKANAKENFWLGIETSAVGLSELSSKVPAHVRAEVEAAKNEILNGKEVFSGIIYDTEGNLQCGENEIISDERLLEHFNWLVEGVKVYEE